MSSTRVRLFVGALALSLVFALVLGATGVLSPRGSVAYGASTSLAILEGEVYVSRDGGPFELVEDGAILGPLDTIRTGLGARAVLTYFEGSTVSIEPDSELRIDQAQSEPDGGTIVTMTQNIGKSWHAVTRLVTGSSQYEVRTPALTASVRGTTFEVEVETDFTGEPTTTVGTTEGAVSTVPPPTTEDPAPRPVVVQAGFETSAKKGEARSTPPRPKPEPEQSVTVETSANTLVLDPFGRANGVNKDGRVVTQTPGAQVIRNADGTLRIVLPDTRGHIATVIETPASPQARRLPDEVSVVTTLKERGKPDETVASRVDTRGSGAQKIVAGVEVSRGGGNAIRTLSQDEKQALKESRVQEPPKPAKDAVPLRRGQRTTDAQATPSARPRERTAEPSATRAGGPGAAGGTDASPTAAPRPAQQRTAPPPTQRRTPAPTPSPKKEDAPARPAGASASPRGFVPVVPALPSMPRGGSDADKDKKDKEDKGGGGSGGGGGGSGGGGGGSGGGGRRP